LVGIFNFTAGPLLRHTGLHAFGRG
jgi:hypothetical protein